MNTSNKKPRRSTKTVKRAPAPPQEPAAGETQASKPDADVLGSEALAAVPADAPPRAPRASIKPIKVTVTSRIHEDRHASIAKAAYFRAESRGFAPGHEVEDWLAAEEEVDQRLLGEGRAS